MDLLNRKLEQALQYLKVNLSEDVFDEEIRMANFAGGNLPDYENPLQAAFYMLKYAKYYALEYYWMYDLALQILSHKTDIKVPVNYSFGCGSMVDGLSYLYAHSKLQEDFGEDYSITGKLYYSAIDLVEWPHTALLNLGETEDMVVKKYLDKGMVKFWDEMKSFHGNMMFFPKLLSENLDHVVGDSSIIDSFCEELVEANMRSKFILLCVSYRGINTYEEDAVKTRKIIDALLEKGYEIEDYSLDDYDWICRDYFEMYDEEQKVFCSRDDVRVDYKEYSDFKVPGEIIRYLMDGDLLEDFCRYYDGRNGMRTASEVCRACRQDCDLLAKPRTSINSGDDHTCFQILAFRRN